MIKSRLAYVLILLLGLGFLLIAIVVFAVGLGGVRYGRVDPYRVLLFFLPFGVSGAWCTILAVGQLRRLRVEAPDSLPPDFRQFEIALLVLAAAGVLGILVGQLLVPFVSSWPLANLTYVGLWCILGLIGGLPVAVLPAVERASGEGERRTTPGDPQHLGSRKTLGRTRMVVLDLTLGLATAWLAWAVLRQVVFLFGTVALSHQPDWFRFLYAQEDVVQRQISAVALLPLTVIVGLRAEQRLGARAAAIVMHTLLGATALALSYRLVGVVALSAVLCLESILRLSPVRPRALWGTWVFAIVVCLLPFDASLRRFPGRGPRIVPAVSGLPAGSTLEKEKAGELVIVGPCSPIYNEPRWILVW